LSEREGKAKVIIFTKHFQIKGDIFLYEGARLTDYMLEAKAFIAVSSAEIMDHQNNKVLTTSFLNVNRDHVEIILPAELPDSL
jgi:hypothetical protein